MPPLPTGWILRRALSLDSFGRTGTAALVVLGILGAHHSTNNTDFVLYDAGWQFQMVLDSPITLDSAQVTAAARRL